MLLKDFGLKDLTEQKAYKLKHIATVTKLLPGYRFILVGDDGEQDPEIYREVALLHPERVEQVLIHKVTDKPSRPPTGQVHFSDYKALARALHRRKLLDDAELKRVKEGK